MKIKYFKIRKEEFGEIKERKLLEKLWCDLDAFESIFSAHIKS